MGFVDTLRRLGSVTGPEEPGQKNAKPGSGGRKPESFSNPEAQTPEEALSFINLLYKSGRMRELAMLLRQSKVFREAWLMLQQASPTGSETSKVGILSSRQTSPDAFGSFPILSPKLGGPGEETTMAKGPAKQQETAIKPEICAVLVNHPEADGCLNPSFEPTYSRTSAIGIYQSQLSYSAQEKDPKLRIDLRV